MKVNELELGQVYTCQLSNQKVLVIESDKIVQPEIKEKVGSKEKVVKEAVTERVKAGKVCYEQQGVKMFSLIELHDGQLTK